MYLDSLDRDEEALHNLPIGQSIGGKFGQHPQWTATLWALPVAHFAAEFGGQLIATASPVQVLNEMELIFARSAAPYRPNWSSQ